jgi:hypothetical protein
MTEFARTQCQDGSRALRVLPSTDPRPKLQAVAFSEGCSLLIQVWKGMAGRINESIVKILAFQHIGLLINFSAINVFCRNHDIYSSTKLWREICIYFFWIENASLTFSDSHPHINF